VKRECEVRVRGARSKVFCAGQAQDLGSRRVRGVVVLLRRRGVASKGRLLGRGRLEAGGCPSAFTATSEMGPGQVLLCENFNRRGCEFWQAARVEMH
jgi:hypothetical protein